MTALDPQWHTKIRTALTDQPQTVLRMTHQLWEQLAHELALIIGDGGFRSLYARSVHLTRADFPWLVNEQSAPTTDFLFTRLLTSLEQQSVTEARAASVRLLITFVDILALLIGESMADNILNSAWNDAALDREKEI